MPVAAAVMILGFLRGMVFGQIHSAEAPFGTAYGITWLVALVVAVHVAPPRDPLDAGYVRLSRVGC